MTEIVLVPTCNSSLHSLSPLGPGSHGKYTIEADALTQTTCALISL